MTKEMVLWIDHRKAVVAIIENCEQIMREIKSNMEPHIQFSSSSGAKNSIDSKEATAEDMPDRNYPGDLVPFNQPRNQYSFLA